MTQQELEKYLWGAATTLRGTIDAGDYKQYIFPLMFFKRISDVYDEEFESALEESDGDLEYAAFAENHHFQIPEGAHWNDVREVTVNVGMALQNAMRAIEKANPDTLYGIFGDASWTNKERLSDEMLTNLIEHYSQHKLNLSNVPDDKLGNAYEYLIKEFADDSGHTAAEFYTNRTVVKLMTMIMDPQPGESVYDPTCGSGGLLLNCALHLKEEGKEYRTLKLYGQEINLITSAIARMNMFMHGIEEFDIARGDTLANPAFLENDELKTFNVILANPPYSIKSWDRKSFESDPYGRNIWGTPPQGCADYAFQQHIQKSLDADNGRSISLWPHGILFRDAEADMRRQMIEADLVECVIGLGPNLFYNSPMEACLLIIKTNKEDNKKGKILFINAVNEVRQDKNMGYLEDNHVDKIFRAYQDFESKENFSVLVSNQDVLDKNGNMAINLYIRPDSLKAETDINVPAAYKQWQDSSLNLKHSMDVLFKELSQDDQLFLQKSAQKVGGVFLDNLNIENFTIDKSDWKKVKLGDVVFEPKESVKDPIADGIKHVVGLEHIDPEDIHLRRSASIEESTTFTKKFSKGDVLFGRRRAYLKKAAQADFEGICSGDITVMRAKEGLLPELLPFIVNNDKFFDFAVEHSAGGLSPRVKFKDLANYEFLNPPKNKQSKILDLLLAMDSVSENVKILKQKAIIQFESFKSLLVFQGGEGEDYYSEELKRDVSVGWKVTSIGNLVDEGFILKIQDGNHGEIHPKSSEYIDEGIPFIMANTLSNGIIDLKKSKKLPKDRTDKLRIGFSYSNDVLLSHKGTVGEVAIVPENLKYPYLMLTPQVTFYRTDPEKLSNQFLYHVFSSNYFQGQLNRLSAQSTRAYVGITSQRKLKLVLPTSVDEQMTVVDKLNKLEKNVEDISQLILSSQLLQKRLISQVF